MTKPYGTLKRVKQPKTKEHLSQPELNSLLRGVADVITMAHERLRYLQGLQSVLWKLCDPENPDTAETFTELKIVQSIIEEEKAFIKRYSVISRKLKTQR